jgi:uncharacterized protein (TIRG00374 family)
MLRALGLKGGTSRWTVWLTSGLALLLLALALRNIDWAALPTTLAAVNPGWLTAAAAVLALSYWARGMRWYLLLPAAPQLTPGLAFHATMAGYLGSSVLPARAGELIRALLLQRRSGISLSLIVATVVIERLGDVIMLVLAGGAVLLTVDQMPDWLLQAAQLLVPLSIVGTIGLVLAPRLEQPIARLIGLLPIRSGRQQQLQQLSAKFMTGMALIGEPRRAFFFVALTAAAWLLDALVIIWLAAGMQLGLSLAAALILLAALGLASVLPSTPGYVGIYQFVAVTVLPLFAVSETDALAFMLIFQALTYLVTIGLGGWGFRAAVRLLRAPAVDAETPA